MNNDKTHTEILDDLGKHRVKILKKQCEWVGISLDDIDLSKQDWYTDYSWSEDEQAKFEEWLADRIMEDDEFRRDFCQKPHLCSKNRERALEVAGRNSLGWTFNYGWTMEEYQEKEDGE